MNDKLFSSWKRHVSNLEEVLKDFSTRRIISVGMTPYPRVIPAVFMTRRAYGIYAVRDSRDIEVIRSAATVFSLGERNPKIAEKVQAMSFLLKSYNFQAFLKSREEPETLVFHRLTPALLSALDDLKVSWAGYDPISCEKLEEPDQFRKFLEKFKLPHLQERRQELAQLLGFEYSKIEKFFNSSFILEPAGSQKKVPSVAVKNQKEWEQARVLIGSSEAWQTVKSVNILPDISGVAASIIGCVTERGVLTSGLHLPLIDVPESLHGISASGKICGYDLSPNFWPEDARSEAQVAAEVVGEAISKKGYVGIFGLNFIFETAKNKLFLTSFNPGFPSDSLEFSQKVLLSGTPPPDFFSFASYLRIPVKFDFEAVNAAWKKTINFSSISISPDGLDHMTMDLQPGSYKHNFRERSAEYIGAKLFSHELHEEKEYLIFDSLLRPGQGILEDATKLFRFFFKSGIAESQRVIKPEFTEILNDFTSALTGVRRG